MHDSESQIAAVLNRPASERLREYKYRFAQSMVFGLPVIALHYFGPMLGGPEAGRWVGMLQILLAGWVMYVGAMGMLVEGILIWKVTLDSTIAGFAIATYSISALRIAYTLSGGQRLIGETYFQWAVLMVSCWTALQWFRYYRGNQLSTH